MRNVCRMVSGLVGFFIFVLLPMPRARAVLARQSPATACRGAACRMPARRAAPCRALRLSALAARTKHAACDVDSTCVFLCTAAA